MALHSLLVIGVMTTSTSVHATSPYDDIVCSYTWDCSKALKIMFCESSNNPRAYSANNYGLFQINGIHGHEINNLYDPEYNIRIAHELYLSRGWQPWIYCARRG